MPVSPPTPKPKPKRPSDLIEGLSKGLSVVEHLDHTGAGHGEAQANSVAFSIPLNVPPAISYQLSMSNNLAQKQYLEPYATDFVYYYKSKPLFGGLHTEVNINDVDNDSIEVAGQGWLHYFERRIWPPDYLDGTYTATEKDIVFIMEELFLGVDNLDGIGIDAGNIPSGQIITYHIDLNDTGTILSKAQELSKMYPGFDFEITWDKQLIVYVPQKGQVLNEYVLEQGANCGSLNYRNPGIGGNFLLGTASGSGGSRAYGTRTDVLSVAKYRRHDASKEFGTVSDPTQLDLQLDGEMPRQASPLKQLSIEWVGDNTIGNIFDEVSTGDTIRVIGDTGYEKVDEYLRIVNMEGAPTDEGDESITFTFDDGSLSL